jgi:Domain of unknown function (DUF4395)
MGPRMRDVGPLTTAIDRLDAQGYVDVDRSTMRELEPWLRWSPAVCAAGMGIGTALASPLILWGLVPFAMLGAIFSRHPFDYLYNFGVRHLTGTQPLPPHGAPRRFACAIASVWLVATGAAFAFDLNLVGYLLGGTLTAVAFIVATTHFCIPSLIYALLFGRPRYTTETA